MVTRKALLNSGWEIDDTVYPPRASKVRFDGSGPELTNTVREERLIQLVLKAYLEGLRGEKTWDLSKAKVELKKLIEPQRMKDYET